MVADIRYLWLRVGVYFLEKTKCVAEFLEVYQDLIFTQFPLVYRCKYADIEILPIRVDRTEISIFIPDEIFAKFTFARWIFE